MASAASLRGALGVSLAAQFEWERPCRGGSLAEGEGLVAGAEALPEGAIASLPFGQDQV